MKKLLDMSPLNILGTDYELLLYSKRWVMEGTPGSVNFPYAKIYIDTDLSDDRIVEVIFHEILEIIKDRFTIDDLPHVALCALEFGIIDVFRHNKEFRQALGLACMGSKGNTYTHEDFAAYKAPPTLPTPLQKEEIRDLLRKKKKEDKSRGTEEEENAQGMGI